MGMEAVGLTGGAAAATAQVGLLTQALGDLTRALPTQKIQQMESAIYDMQAATGMSEEATQALTTSINRLADSTRRYTRTELVSTISQLRSMPSLLTENTREFERMFTTMTAFSRANAPQYMRTLTELSGKYPMLTKNIMDNKNAFTTLYSVMQVQGIRGLEAASKAYEAFGGKVEDAGAKLRTFRDLMKSVVTGMERVATGTTGKLLQGEPGMVMKAAGAMQEYDLLSTAALGAGAWGTIKGYRHFLGGRGGGGGPSAGAEATARLADAADMSIEARSVARGRGYYKAPAAASRWAGLGRMMSPSGGLVMGRLLPGMAGLAATNIADVEAEKQGGYGALTATGSVAGMAGMGFAVAGPLGAIAGATAGILKTVEKHYQLELSREQKRSADISKEYVDTFIMGKATSRAAGRMSAAGVSGGYVKPLSEMSALLNPGQYEDILNKNMSAEEQVRAVTARIEQFRNVRDIDKTRMGVGTAGFSLATTTMAGAQERGAAIDTAYDKVTKMLPAQREMTELLEAQAAKDVDNVVITQAAATERQKLISLEQQRYAILMDRATVEARVDQESVAAIIEKKEAETSYLYGSGGPEKETRMLKVQGEAIKANVKLLWEQLDVAKQYGAHATAVATKKFEAELERQKLNTLQQTLVANDEVIAQKRHEMGLLEKEKTLQETLYKYRGGALASASLAAKQLPLAMDALNAAKKKLDDAKDLPQGERRRAIENEFADAKNQVASLVDYQRRSVIEAITASTIGAPGDSGVMPFSMGEMQKYGPAWMSIPGFRSGSAQNAPTRTRLQDPYRSMAEQLAALVASMENTPKGTAADPSFVKMMDQPVSVPHM